MELFLCVAHKSHSISLLQILHNFIFCDNIISVNGVFIYFINNLTFDLNGIISIYHLFNNSK